MLLAMFKDTPKTEIEAILASVGNVNRAAEALLKQSTCKILISAVSNIA